jgi:mono/diheme cytochrome c family protein
MKKSLVALAIIGSSAMAGNVANGKALYDANCGACHNSQAIAPSLAQAGKYTGKYLKQSILHPEAVIAKGYTNSMPSFSWMDKGSIRDLISYIKSSK